jgi:hypothetical protein
MSQSLAIVETTAPIISKERALKILAKSLYRDLRQNGYEPKQIIAVASELVGLVAADIKEETLA